MTLAIRLPFNGQRQRLVATRPQELRQLDATLGTNSMEMGVAETCSRILKSMAAGLAFVFLGGCIISDGPKSDYPVTWPQIRQTGDVENGIIGRYSCHGESERGAGEWYLYSLAGFLVGDKGPLRCSYVEIVRSGSDNLQFIYWGQDKQVLRQAYKKIADYSVKDGWIELSSRTRWKTGNLGLGHSSETPYLNVDNEGNLVVKLQRSNTGLLFFVIPSMDSGTSWGHFQRIESAH